MAGKHYKRIRQGKRNLTQTKNRMGKAGKPAQVRYRIGAIGGRFRKGSLAASHPGQRSRRHVADDKANKEGTYSEERMLPEREVAFAYEEGYRQGFYEGGEAKLCKKLPPYTVLPYMTLDDVISRGIEQVTSALVPVLPPSEVFAEVIQALDQRLPLSVIRLGDGELLTLAHDMTISTEQAKLWGPFLPYAGVNLPDAAARRLLAQSIRQASIVGIPESRHPTFQGLLFPALKQLGISYQELRMTSSTVNYALNEQGLLFPMLQGRKLLLIGNKAAGLADVLGRQGLEIAGIIMPVNGVQDVRRIIEQVARIDFDLALVAAGIAAVMICTAIAGELGKVSFDMGHLANQLESGEALLLPGSEVNK
ncbi:GT-D fold domain-containing glycosyltransferase [Paenibacillus fonticola]|uniref:GT-D fold domain-containing glycosyltransferase n=1 Tax=Paenibacillus fonticola TaxID=379896 RepID=UPI000375E6EB|nr:GT-D fold domain-containing glycosyltransferase [Paenibacillus fonticola]